MISICFFYIWSNQSDKKVDFLHLQYTPNISINTIIINIDMSVISTTVVSIRIVPVLHFIFIEISFIEFSFINNTYRRVVTAFSSILYIFNNDMVHPSRK